MDTVIGTVVNVTPSFPQILLAVAVVAALGPSLVTIVLVLGLTGWERYGRVIRAEAALSLLGVGSGSAYPTWGHMISLGRDSVTVAWWLSTAGLAIFLTVLAINLVGDRLRDALDPRRT